MANSKKESNLKVNYFLLFAYFLVFPFGQLLQIPISFLGYNFSILAADIIVFLFFLANFWDLSKIKIYGNFLWIAFFSLVLSVGVLGPYLVLPGFLYYLRFLGYVIFFAGVSVLLKSQEINLNKSTLYNSLIFVAFVSGIFGWLQYFWLPDLRTLKFFGWDDHYWRLTGTFIDPAFLGIILVLGFLLVFSRFLQRTSVKLLFLVVFFIITIAFTYARASYLALVLGIFMLSVKSKKSLGLLFGLMFLATLFFLPRPQSEGVKLERTSSIYAKVDNYLETLVIIDRNALFGIGFNNICAARNIHINKESFESHSCSGSDASLLLVWATTGLVGLMAFISDTHGLYKRIDKNFMGVLLASGGAIFVNSLFVNSLFYSFVLGWLSVLLAISLRD